MPKKLDEQLIQAVLKRDHAGVATALEEGADPNAATKGVTPMHLAALLGLHSQVQILSSHGATADARDDIGRTPLHYAALAPSEGRGSLEVVKALIDAGADVNAEDRRGCRPLDLAAGVRAPEIAKALSNAGATCMPDREGWVQRVTASGETTTPTVASERRTGP